MDKSFQQAAGICALIAGPLSILSLIIGLAGVGYDFEVFSDASRLIAAGADAASNIRWSFRLNMLGNYLLLIPVAVALYAWAKPGKTALAQLFTAGGLLYMILGALGASILAEAWPLLMERYAAANAADQSVLIVNFELVQAIAESGMQGIMQNGAGALWFLGMGSLLRQEKRWLGILMLGLGIFLLLNTLGNLFNIEALTLLGLTANILIGPIWAIWIGWILFQKQL